MGLFSALFGKKKTESTKIVGSLDVMAAINAHVLWKVRLEKYMDGTSEETLDPQVICLDNQCTLGKWIHGPAHSFFQNDESFVKLREDHANFHQIASKVVTKVLDNDRATAEAIMKNEYFQASRKVVTDLTVLSKQLLAVK